MAPAKTRDYLYLHLCPKSNNLPQLSQTPNKTKIPIYMQLSAHYLQAQKYCKIGQHKQVL